MLLTSSFVRARGVKAAAAGIDRLVLKDPERENHTEAAAFLAGYFLGLPCFCFLPDVGEAMRSMRDYPGSLDAYKQPRAVKAAAAAAAAAVATASANSPSSGGRGVGSLLDKLKRGSSTTSTTSTTTGTSSSSSAFGQIMESSDITSTLSTEAAEAARDASVQAAFGRSLMLLNDVRTVDTLGLGRVLVWMMAPVAAEKIKYGKTVVSDPKRASRLLDVLEALQQQQQPSTETAAASGIPPHTPISIPIPSIAADRTALLQWAYFEAEQLVLQYGDLVEEVADYLGSGTSTVGEVVALVEQEMR